MNKVEKEKIQRDVEIELLEKKNYEKNMQLNNLKQNILGKSLKSKLFQDITPKYMKNCETLYGISYKNFYVDNNNIYTKKLGNLYTYKFITSEPLIVIGLSKLSLVIIYELTLQASFYILFFTLAKEVYPYMKYMLIGFYLNCFINHLFIFLTNPGIPNKNYYLKNFLNSEKYIDMTDIQKQNYYLCEICNIIANINEDIVHCEECNICLKGYDHHCNWTGKCITNKNIISFHFFSIGTFIYIVWYAIVVLSWMLLQISKLLNKIKK